MMNPDSVRTVTLREVLEARDARAALQTELLAACGKPVLCVTMNIPGPVKRSPLIDFAFEEQTETLRLSLMKALHPVRRTDRPAGLELTCICDLPADVMKDIAIKFEDHLPVGRLFDLDVIGTDGRKLSRPEPRTCLVCGGPAGPCARSRAHGLEAVRNAADVLLRDFAADTLAERAVGALTGEAELTPKPGLVDQDNNGAHQDMDLEMFRRSAQCLRSYFRRAVELGMERADCMPALQRAGLEAEQTMFAVTGGVNTHKGAIYAFGLMLAALGSRLIRGGDVFRTAAALAGAGRLPSAATHGGRARERYGVAGARGEAMAGFPHVREACILLDGQPPDAALLMLLAKVDDTNLLHRGGWEGLRFVQEQARAIWGLPAAARKARLEELDRMCRERNLSPGGCADLLALAMLLDGTRKIWENKE